MNNNWKHYVKTGGRILFDYVMSFIVFAIFIYVLISIAKDNFGTWLDLYSGLIFLLMFYIIYTEVKAIAVKEKRPQYEMNPYPLKGLVYGLIGTVPIALLTGIASLVRLDSPFMERIRHLAINSILGPMYFIISWFNETFLGYVLALLMIPLVSMLGYLAGYYGIEIWNKIRKKKVVEEKGFTKSPWNPSNSPSRKSGKKKSKSGDGSGKSKGREQA